VNKTLDQMFVQFHKQKKPKTNYKVFTRLHFSEMYAAHFCWTEITNWINIYYEYCTLFRHKL